MKMKDSQEHSDHTQHESVQMDHSKMNHNAMGGVHKERNTHHDHHAMMAMDFKKRFYFSLILMIPILLLSPMIQMFMGVDLRFFGDSYLLFALSTVLFLYGGKPFLKGARDELRKKSPAMMMLISLAIIVAYVYSTYSVFVSKGKDFFWELATLIVIMLLGHWIEMKSVMGASKSLDELIKLMPENAHLVMENGETMDVPVTGLKAGQLLLVKPGERIPIDGTVNDGDSSVNESLITGESVPVHKKLGDDVIGGSINGEGILKFKVSRVGDQTFLSQVMKMVTEAQAAKSKTQRTADIAAKWLFYISVSVGILTFVLWLIFGKDINFAIERAVTVIIIACPHALGLAAPLVTAVSTNIGAKNGLLIRNRAAFENARKVNSIVFDKTGTLTEGKFGVTDVIAMTGNEKDLLKIVYSIERNSEHPIAQGIVNEAEKQKLDHLPITDYQNLTGMGLRAKVDGKEIKITGPGYLRSEGISYENTGYEKLAQDGKTVVFILDQSTLLGYIALSDITKISAKQAVDTLKNMGIESIMLTGDNQRAAAYVGKRLGIEKIYSEVLPQEKTSHISTLQQEGRFVAMTGDGVNDAPSLAKANLGIAIGAGTDVAIETADVILVRSDPLDVVNLIKLSKVTYKKMFQNLFWATGYNIIAIPLAAGLLYNQGIVISPALGAVLMSISTIIVSINAKLLKIK